MANNAAAINDKTGSDNTEFLVAIHFFGLPDPVLLANDLPSVSDSSSTADAFLVTKLRMFQAIVAADTE
jgi:hypothetical protein